MGSLVNWGWFALLEACATADLQPRATVSDHLQKATDEEDRFLREK